MVLTLYIGTHIYFVPIFHACKSPNTLFSIRPVCHILLLLQYKYILLFCRHIIWVGIGTIHTQHAWSLIPYRWLSAENTLCIHIDSDDSIIDIVIEMEIVRNNYYNIIKRKNDFKPTNYIDIVFIIFILCLITNYCLYRLNYVFRLFSQ